MLRKILKVIIKNFWKILIVLFIILFFFAVAIPAYLDYKANKKEVVVDTSGELAVSKNVNNTDEDDSSDDNENKWELESKEYDPFIFDDRILLFEGDITGDSMAQLADVLIEDIDSQTYAKMDIELNGNSITYSDIDTYRFVLNDFKNSVNLNNNYNVSFESSLGTVKKIIITSK